MSEVDAALRQVSRRFPEALARALAGPGATVRAARWVETQLAARQRNLDRALRVDVDGRVVVHHVEWAWRWRRSLPYRMFEYHAMLAMALRSDSKGPPPIKSTAVLLSGRGRPWPSSERYCTSPEGEAFTGVRFRVDAVYQQSVEALRSRGSELWLAFAPIALDADARKVAAVARELTERVPDEGRLADLAAAMVVLAESDARGRGLAPAIAPFFPREMIMRSSIYTMGHDEGRAEGRAEGLRTAIIVLCEAYGVPLDDERQRWLTSATADVLDERLAQLRARRVWPA